jgi:hypothetical protein
MLLGRIDSGRPAAQQSVMVADRQPLPYIHTLAEFDRDAYLEQRLFALSPLNLWLTAAALYALLIAAYALAAWIDGAPWIVPARGGYTLGAQARTALILALIACVALAMQRYSHIRDCEEAPALADALQQSRADSTPSFPSRSLGVATLLGALGGAAAVIVFNAPTALKEPGFGIARFVWFSLMTILLCVMFARGVELNRAGSKGAQLAIEKGLVIDLLQIDRLYAWGRMAARNSLTWFAVSAAGCLLFVSLTSPVLTVALLGGCVVMGLWAFVANMGQIHHRIRLAKEAELRSVRAEIAALKAQLSGGADVAHKLHSLLAYEARIAAAPEWPVDQTILVRLFGSALILAVPWFGQAVAGVLVQHMGALVR